ncbi:MAG: hypothetical protein OZ948_19625 [Deltaproteobacteria bacterium]|nr:hypothetical protein [Deltaproteobacteria bacterium]
MARIDLALVEWPETPEAGPRLLGRLADPDLVAAARERIAAARRRDLAALEAPVRLVPEAGAE